MNYNIILFLLFLARNFGSSASFCYELLSIPLLAQSFLRAQGVCLLDTGYVLSYIEDVQTGKNNAVITRNNRQKTNPKVK